MPHEESGGDVSGEAVSREQAEETLRGWLQAPDARRVAVVVAHPDDEVLGCGALLTRLEAVRVVHVTDGAPRDGADAARHGFPTPAAYAAARAAEAADALALAGVPAAAIRSLGIADQEASLNLGRIADMLAAELGEAAVVLTHAFEGGHSDHDAVAFAVHAAVEKLPHRPLLVEMPFYHAGPEGWMRQRFLPQRGAGVEHVMALDADARDLKRRMVAAHHTQAETLAGFDLAAERFRLAPAYAFAERPVAGDLLYERHGWQLDWPSWVARVRQAASGRG